MIAKRCHIVVNPRGGRRRGLAILESVRPVFEEAGWELAVSATERAGHAQELARTLPLDGYDGSHVTLDCVEYQQVRSLAIESTGGEALDLDGEIKGRAPFQAELLPGAMRVFT